MLPLAGTTVVSLEQAIAAPFATRHLADLGARVIKVERKDTGDFARYYDTTVNGLSSHFTWVNRSKESVALDLKQEDHKKIIFNMLKSADVFIHNLAPGAVDRLGFSNEYLATEFPELIICSISGFGKGGDYEFKKAYDLIIQCEAGLVSITGTEESPAKSGISIADIAAGMYAFSSILTALLNRKDTGKGSIIEISMLEALAEWMGYPLYYAKYGGSEPKRTGVRHATIYPYGPFTVGDGKQVFLGIQNEREWSDFCKIILNNPEFIHDSRFSTNSKRNENATILKEIIEAKFKEMTLQEAIQLLDQVKIANAPLNSLFDLSNHPQLKQRKRWKKVDSPVGELEMLIPPATFNNIGYIMNPIPSLGEHTEKIIEEFSHK